MEQRYDSTKSEATVKAFSSLWTLLQEKMSFDFKMKLGRLWASTSAQCLRKLIAAKEPDWIDLPIINDTSEMALGSFFVGIAIHEKMERMMNEDKWDKYKFHMVSGTEGYQKYIDTDPETGLEYTITGTYDLRLQIQHAGIQKTVVADWKSFKAIRRRNTGELVDKYMLQDYHLMQLSFYQAMNGGVDGMLIYISRNEVEPHLVGLGWDNPDFRLVCPTCNKIHELTNATVTGQQLWNKIKTKAIKMVRYEHDHTLPPRPVGFTRTTYECDKLCAYTDLCYGKWGNDEYKEPLDFEDLLGGELNGR